MSETPEPPKEPLPKAADLLREVRVAEPGRLQASYSRRFSKQSIEAQLEWEHLEGLRGHYKHKGRWSWFLMAVMAFMIWFQSYLLYKVGTKAWDFTDYEWLLPVLLAQNLAQVVGLAVFVVKALFKDLKGD